MLAPYDLASQYWPLEEQETLYRNSKASPISFFFDPLLISLLRSPDQLVITKHPHTKTTRRPVLIKVSSLLE